jgi:hypothetical protein
MILNRAYTLFIQEVWIVNKNCLTWCDLLERKGFESSVSKSLIGFVSWNEDDEDLSLGDKISDVLNEHKGKVFPRDVKSSHYNDNGLLFFNSEISDEIAKNVFDAIMEQEQEEVYNM